MKEILKKYTSRKLVVAICGTIAMWQLHPENAKEIAGLLGLPALYVIMEGLKDIFGKKN